MKLDIEYAIPKHDIGDVMLSGKIYKVKRCTSIDGNLTILYFDNDYGFEIQHFNTYSMNEIRKKKIKRITSKNIT